MHCFQAAAAAAAEWMHYEAREEGSANEPEAKVNRNRY